MEKTKTRQLGVREYMSSQRPNEISFRGDLSAFSYNGVKFYPVAAKQRATKGFTKKECGISFSKPYEEFSSRMGYDYSGFYEEAGKHGYGNCDVFACVICGDIDFVIPTDNMLAKYPMAMREHGYMRKTLEKMLD